MFTRIFGPSRAQQLHNQQLEVIRTPKGISVDSSYKQMVAKEILLRDRNSLENPKILKAFFDALASNKKETLANQSFHVSDIALKNILELHKTFPRGIGRLAAEFIANTPSDAVPMELNYLAKEHQWSTSMITPEGVRATLRLPGMTGPHPRFDIVKKLEGLMKHNDPKIAVNATRTLLSLSNDESDTILRVTATSVLSDIFASGLDDDKTRNLKSMIRTEAKELGRLEDTPDYDFLMKLIDRELAGPVHISSEEDDGVPSQNIVDEPIFDYKTINFTNDMNNSDTDSDESQYTEIDTDFSFDFPVLKFNEIDLNNDSNIIDLRLDFEANPTRPLSPNVQNIVWQWMSDAGDKYNDVPPKLTIFLALSNIDLDDDNDTKNFTKQELDEIRNTQQELAETLARSSDRDEQLAHLLDMVENLPEKIVIKSARKAIRTLMTLKDDDLRHSVRSFVIDAATKAYALMPHPEDTVGPNFLEGLVKLNKSDLQVPEVFPTAKFISPRSIYKPDRQYVEKVRSLSDEPISVQADYFLQELNSSRDISRRGAKELLDTLKLDRNTTIRRAVKFVHETIGGNIGNLENLSDIDPLILILARMGSAKNQRLIALIDKTLASNINIEDTFARRSKNEPSWKQTIDYFRTLSIEELLATGQNQENPNTIYKAFGIKQINEFEEDLTLFAKSKKKVLVMGAHRGGHFTTFVCVKDKDNKIHMSILDSLGGGTRLPDNETTRYLRKLVGQDNSPLASVKFVGEQLQWGRRGDKTSDPYAPMENSCGLFSLMMNDWINTLDKTDPRLNSSNPGELVNGFVQTMKSMREISEYSMGQLNLHYRLKAISNSLDVVREKFMQVFERNWYLEEPAKDPVSGNETSLDDLSETSSTFETIGSTSLLKSKELSSDTSSQFSFTH